MYTPADKTSNLYRTSKEEYCRLRHNAITSTYKKANKNLAGKINKLGKKFAKSKGVLEKMDANGTGNCFITLKDHKENFANNPQTRLLNPAKNEIGRISKDILDQINKELRNALQLNQWRNTKDVISWLKEIENTPRCKFIQFDIKEFYPSIKESLLKNALDFAKQHVRIKKTDYDTIMQARKSLLYCDGEPWMKKEAGIFDVTMGAFDGAEICELVGIFLLSQLATSCDKKRMGLYRDDGLAVFANMSGPQAEKMKKKFQKVFNDNGLEITIKTNLKIVDYLDVTFNLSDGTYKPYRKPNDETRYINAKSNHPPNILKQLPIAIEDRLRNLSSSKRIFDEAAPHYQEALDKSGYKYKIKFERNGSDEDNNDQDGNVSTQGTRRNRARNIIWFNPPFSKSVSTNVAKYFLELIEKHFPIRHKFRKLFNRNNLKVSYSCMRNMKAIVNSHNKKILTEERRSEGRTCNCPRNRECPLNGKCLSENTLYNGKITSNLRNYGVKNYAGMSEPAWKLRLGNHTYSFNHREAAKCEIAKEVWKIKDQGGDYNIEWSIIGHAPAYNPVTKKCNLCTSEKVYIAEHLEHLINKRDELISKCPHRRKYALELL